MAIVIEVESEIQATVDRVWTVIAAFERYGRWHPTREIIGPAEPNARLTIRVGPDPAQRWEAPARLTVFEPGRRMTIQTGGGLFGRVFETVLLEPVTQGTRLVLIAVVPFWTGWINGGRQRYESEARELYQQVGKALAVEAGRSPPCQRAGLGGNRGRL
ncbi:hypothetical protein CFHF_19040 [Caulobacter flavus]|uniref:SRPBCC domain-containing protein n=1 Tax=Caulobacter flavus TaxID=1679497 RepID=A0A2N5CQ06_9CAUL|nr:MULTISPECIES: SRPBCC family protein [Caulobacter]PLR09234.1 hypothetical protein CFHF_19040 [Caulobacter flavus]